MAEAVALKPGAKVEPKASAPVPDMVKRASVKFAEQVRNTWEITVPTGTTEQQLLQPGFWAPVVDMLSTRDMLYVEPLDGSWIAEIRVLWANRERKQPVQVALLRKIDLPRRLVQVNTGLPSGWSIAYLDLERGYGAHCDGELRMANFRSQEECEHWITSHVTTR